jgi:hypothetical protein
MEVNCTQSIVKDTGTCFAYPSKLWRLKKVHSANYFVPHFVLLRNKTRSFSLSVCLLVNFSMLLHNVDPETKTEFDIIRFPFTGKTNNFQNMAKTSQFD